MSTLEERYFRPDNTGYAHRVHSFLTCRLAHSIPFSAREELMRYRFRCDDQLREPSLDHAFGQEEYASHLFRFWDAVLGCSPGPAWLAHPAVADFTQITLHAMEGILCRLEGYVILPTHVHVLYSQHLEFNRGPAPLHVADGLKAPVAHYASRILELRGPFWQDADYHRILRNNKEVESVKRYIRRDPVRAGLTDRPEDWLWAWERKD
jgi:REP element-mobilizing transposase RayT